MHFLRFSFFFVLDLAVWGGMVPIGAGGGGGWWTRCGLYDDVVVWVEWVCHEEETVGWEGTTQHTHPPAALPATTAITAA